jgi:mRNA-degrading endonuclease RelE of RelBE toxin-antitoxin system
MNFDVEVSSYFKKQVKRLIKKYPSLKKEIDSLISDLAINPEQGSGIGRGCFKIRIAISSKGKGKSGGARVITHVHSIRHKVYLLSIFDKSEMENLSDSELKFLLSLIPD